MNEIKIKKDIDNVENGKKRDREIWRNMGTKEGKKEGRKESRKERRKKGSLGWPGGKKPWRNGSLST